MWRHRFCWHSPKYKTTDVSTSYYFLKIFNGLITRGTTASSVTNYVILYKTMLILYSWENSHLEEHGYRVFNFIRKHLFCQTIGEVNMQFVWDIKYDKCSAFLMFYYTTCMYNLHNLLTFRLYTIISNHYSNN